MSITLPNGMKLPQTSDRGNQFFPDLESNIQTVDSHIGAANAHGASGNILGSENKTTVAVVNNQTVAASVTGVSLSSATHHIGLVFVSLRRRTDSSEAIAFGWLKMIYSLDRATWTVDFVNFGDDIGVTFSITSAGQVQYTSTSIAGLNYFGTLHYDFIKKMPAFTNS